MISDAQVAISKWSVTHTGMEHVLQTRVFTCSSRMHSWSLSCSQCSHCSSKIVLMSATMMMCGCWGYIFNVLVCCGVHDVMLVMVD